MCGLAMQLNITLEHKINKMKSDKWENRSEHKVLLESSKTSTVLVLPAIFLLLL